MSTTLHVVMPAFNEAEGIVSFIEEIRAHVQESYEHVRFFVVDDRSTDGTAEALRALSGRVGDVHTVTAEENKGHGPTALAAYRLGLEPIPDVLVHVDGDGQFLGQDFPLLLRALADADVAHGVRHGRTDPWYRRVLTRAVQLLVLTTSGVNVPDVNTPMRAYRPDAIEALLGAVGGQELLVPHVHFSIAESRLGLQVRFVSVNSRPRRGASGAGTMWGAVTSTALPPRRLRAFARSALVELWQLSLRPGARLRSLPRAHAATGPGGVDRHRPRK